MTSNNRIIEGDTQQLNDLLMMLEKMLWHGFKASGQKALIVLKTPDAELWTAITKMARSDTAMLETTTCVEQIDSLVTPISRLRAFLRIAMMQKKLADFFAVITSSVLLKDFYDSWALLRQEDVIQLTGALLGLSVVDCNLVLEYDHLQEQPLSVDLLLYIRIPTISTIFDDADSNSSFESDFAKEKKFLLDQNNYLEERNRQLQLNVNNLKSRLNSTDSEGNSDSITIEQEMVSFKAIDDKTNEQFHNKEKDWNEERSRLLAQIVEREDSLRIMQQQLMDLKKVKSDLYEKLRLSEDSVHKLRKDISRMSENYTQERNNLKRTIKNMEDLNRDLNERSLRKEPNDGYEVRLELEKKCQQYATILSRLESKQNELAMVHSELSSLKYKTDSMSKDLKELPVLKEELKELQEKYMLACDRADESERALEELGGHLSESKLRMVELAEELLPLSDAHWAKDSEAHQCSGCLEKFTLAKRKHHCRMCGSIFCAACSEGRVKLPSNAKPARVCEQCFNLLMSRQSGGGQ
uniref:FYVE-type domain-containing protein n=1 Tax=Heterorhabditis bacteriophora TaxID=37862 RepID=A0A1I7XKV4_HETBA